MDRHEIEFDQHPFFAAVLHRDRPVSVRCAHFARREVHQVAVLSDQPEGLRPMILHDEVAGHQRLRE